MEEHSKEISTDKYDDIFEAVLSSRESESHTNSVPRNEPIKTSNVNLKKRQLSLKQENLNTTVRKKKRRETTRDRILEWNKFYSDEEFGIWIECTECNKWRKVMEYEEDHEVPNDWCCSMSLSGIKGCGDPENIEAEDFSPVDFVPGTIVWAKLEGYPWWPGMVEDDPDTEEYYWIEDNGVCYYNVTFLDDKVSHAWVPASFVCSYLKPIPQRKHCTEKYKASKYSNLIEAAKKKADEAITMPIKERLKLFSFACRYEGKWSLAPNLDDDEDAEDITEMLIKELEDIESIKSTDSDYRSDSSSEQKKNKKGLHNGNLFKNTQNSNSKCSKYKKSLNKMESKKGSYTEVEIKLNDDDNVISNQSNDDKEAIKTLKRFINAADNYLENSSPSTTDTKTTEETITASGHKIKKTLNEKNLLQSEENKIMDEAHIKINKLEKESMLHKEKARKYVNSKEKTNLTSKMENKKDKMANIMPTCHLESKKLTQKVKSNRKESTKKEISDKSLNKKFKPPLKMKEKDNNRNEIDKLNKNEIVSNGTSPLNSEIKSKKSLNKEFHNTNFNNSDSHMDTSFKEEMNQSANTEPALNKRKNPDKMKLRNDGNKNDNLKCNAKTKQNEGNSSLNITQNKMDLPTKSTTTEITLNNKENEAFVNMSSTECIKTEIKTKQNNEQSNIENTKTKQVLKILEKNCVGQIEPNSETISTADSKKNTPEILTAKINMGCEDKKIRKNNLGGDTVNSRAQCKSLNDNTKSTIEFPKKKVLKKVKVTYPSTKDLKESTSPKEKKENINRKKTNITNTIAQSSTFSKKNVNKKVEETHPSTKELHDSPPNNLKSQTEDKNANIQQACIPNTNTSTKNKLVKLIYTAKKIENNAVQQQIKEPKTEKENRKENKLKSIFNTPQKKTENIEDSHAIDIITISEDESSSHYHSDKQEKNMSLSFDISMQQSENEDSDPFEVE